MGVDKFNNSTPSPLPPNSSAAQLRLFKSLTIILALALLVGIGYTYYKQHQIEPVQVLVNGRPITTTTNSSVAAKIIDDIKTGADAGLDFRSMNPEFIEKVQYQRISDKGSPIQIDGDDDAKAKLKAALHVTVECSMITVDRQPVVALPNKSLAQQSLDAVRKYYENMPPNDPIEGESKFVEKVSIVDKRAPLEFAKENVDDAVKFLTTSPPAKTYTVQSHETGWTIARKFHIPFGKWRASNTGRDINRLGIGDTVNVSITTPPVTVLVKKRSNREEAILKNAPANRAGKRQISEVISYLNGQRSGSPEEMSVNVLQQAAPVARLN